MSAGQGETVCDEGCAIGLGELVEKLGGELHGDEAIVIRQVAPLDTAGPENIAFLASAARSRAMQRCRAGAIVVGPGVTRVDGAYIVAANPYAYFIRIAALLNPGPRLRPSTHRFAVVHDTAQVASSAEVGPFVTIDEGACIGERVRLGPGCRIGAHARVGDDSTLHANVSVYPRCVIGARAVLNAGAVVGADGFGGAMEDGRWLKMPHIGRVVLGDDVEVGANTTIDRGAMADTVIGDGVKMDNQIQVGHNVRIGAHTSIAGCAGIAGSATIGAYCVIGGGAIVLGHLTVADHVQISAGTVVTGSIRAAGRYSGIYPVAEHRAWLRSAVSVRRAGTADRHDRKTNTLMHEQPDKTDDDGH